MNKSLSLVGKVLGAIAAIVIIVGGLIMLAESQERNSEASPLSNTVLETDHVMGNREAKVTVFEYADFQCPACRTYAPLMERLYDEYGDRVQFVFRNFPLYSIHPNAEVAARAAEAASIQGKFFEYSTVLFEKQAEWESLNNPSDKFSEYAGTLGLNVDQFKSDYRSGAVKAKVNADYRSGLEAGVNSTPSFFINGRSIEESPRGYEAFKKILDDELTATGTPAPTDTVPTEEAS